MTAISPNQDVAMAIALSGQGLSQAAEQQVFGQQGIEQGQALLAADLDPAIVNEVNPGGTLPAGTLVKKVVGGEPQE